VHDLSDGGLAVAAADVALASQVGITLDAPADEPHGALFGEDQARYLIATPNAADVLKAAAKAGVPAAVIGKVEGEALSAPGLFSIPLETLRKAHEAWMPAFMSVA
jgi:phosphoribosylformylglycinamidine synthase